MTSTDVNEYLTDQIWQTNQGFTCWFFLKQNQSDSSSGTMARYACHSCYNHFSGTVIRQSTMVYQHLGRQVLPEWQQYLGEYFPGEASLSKERVSRTVWWHWWHLFSWQFFLMGCHCITECFLLQIPRWWTTAFERYMEYQYDLIWLFSSTTQADTSNHNFYATTTGTSILTPQIPRACCLLPAAQIMLSSPLCDGPGFVREKYEPGSRRGWWAKGGTSGSTRSVTRRDQKRW